MNLKSNIFVLTVFNNISKEGSPKALDTRQKQNSDRNVHSVRKDLNFVDNNIDDTFAEPSKKLSKP